jgi:hypothetical protein
MVFASILQEQHMTKYNYKYILITRVPNGSVEVSLGPIILDRPKSTNFTTVKSLLSIIKIFSSFKSLWAIPY